MIDLHELDTLAADLTHAGLLAGVRVLAVVEDASAKIEHEAKSLAPRTRLPHLAGTINHDVTIEAGKIVGEIGTDAEVNGQAYLAHIFEYGAPAKNLGPRPFVTPPVDHVEPSFIAAVEAVGGQIL